MTSGAVGAQVKGRSNNVGHAIADDIGAATRKTLDLPAPALLLTAPRPLCVPSIQSAGMARS